MTAYYNETDPKAAAWLRELIKHGHIADGVVDERSIEDIRPNRVLPGYTPFCPGVYGMLDKEPKPSQATSCSSKFCAPPIGNILACERSQLRAFLRNLRKRVVQSGLMRKIYDFGYPVLISFESVRDMSLPSSGVSNEIRALILHWRHAYILANRSIYLPVLLLAKNVFHILDSRGRLITSRWGTFFDNELCIVQNRTFCGNVTLSFLRHTLNRGVEPSLSSISYGVA